MTGCEETNFFICPLYLHTGIPACARAWVHGPEIMGLGWNSESVMFVC